MIRRFKERNMLQGRCAVLPDANDKIYSGIIKLVNSYWKPANLATESSPRNYEKVRKRTPHNQYDTALAHRTKWREDIGKAIAWKAENDGSTRMIREVNEYTKSLKPKIFEIPKPEGGLYEPMSWVSAYWKVAHQAETGDAGLVFTIFSDRIVERVQEVPTSQARILVVYGVHKNAWVMPGHRWNGQEVGMNYYHPDHQRAIAYYQSQKLGNQLSSEKISGNLVVVQTPA